MEAIATHDGAQPTLTYHRRKHPIALLSSPVFAAPDCSLYPLHQQARVSHLAVAGPRAMKNVSDEFGNIVDPMWGRPIVKLDTSTLPESISDKLVYRFTDAATKGLRSANGRTVCNFKYEANDGCKIEKGWLAH